MRPAAGNFQVFMDRKYVRVMFRIRLHVDDVAILYRIKECAYKKYSMGLRPARGRKSSYWERCRAYARALFVITNAGDLINVLFPILDQYKLLTTGLIKIFDFYSVAPIEKICRPYLDYLDFAKVVKKLVTNKSSVFTGEDLTWLKNCIKNMNALRAAEMLLTFLTKVDARA